MDNILNNIKQRFIIKAKLLTELAESETLHKNLYYAVDLISNCFKKDKKILFIGNGGSAAQCQHIAAEYVNRFKMDRIPLPAISLTTDTSVITSISNDFNYNKIFSKQVEAIGNVDDILIAYSTSGSSKNIIEAIHSAKKKKMKIIFMTGASKPKIMKECDIVFEIKSISTAEIQEIHLVIDHIICEFVEQSLFGKV